MKSQLTIASALVLSSLAWIQPSRGQLAVDPPTVANTAQLLTDSLQGMYTDSSSADTQFWTSGVWNFTNDYTGWGEQGGPTTAAAVLWQWRMVHNYTSGADATVNSWLRGTAEGSINSSLTRITPDGAYAAAGDNIEMYLADLCATYLALRDTLTPTVKANWLNAMMEITAYLINTNNLPNADFPAGSWEATDGWYVNGNIEVLEAQDLYQMYLCTGDIRYYNLYKIQWTHTVTPPSSKWSQYGLRYVTQPTKSDGSDGAGYLVESNGTDYGYDGDYTQLQSVCLARLYALSMDPNAQYVLNLEVNQLLSYTNTSTWVLDAENGSRHSLEEPLATAGIQVLNWLTSDRTDLTADVKPQFSLAIEPMYIDNACQNWGSLYDYRGYGNSVATALICDMTTTSKPAVPSTPTAVASSGSVGLSWNNVPGALYYNVERATSSGGPYTVVATSPPSSYIDNTVSNGTTYYYAVAAANNAGTSAISGQVQAAPSAVAPAAPSTLAITTGNAYIATNTPAISLTWLLSPGAKTYNILRGTSSGGPYSSIATGLAASSIAPYVDTTVTAGTTYYYVATATNSSGTSGYSPQASATATTIIPPTNLVATAGSSQVSLYYGGSTSATGYNILRSTTNGGPYTTVASNTTTDPYVDTGLGNGTAYYYVMQALTPAGTSANSAQVVCIPTPLPVPTNVLAAPGNGKVTLTWGASSGATSYTVKRGTGGVYTTIGTSTTTSYTDASATNGTLYYYIVSATGSAGTSPTSGWVSVTPTATVYPAAPTGLAATGGTNQISLSWSAEAGATSYEVEKSTFSGGPYTVISSGASATSYTDTRVESGTTYYYVVAGVNSSGAGPISSQVKAAPSN